MSCDLITLPKDFVNDLCDKIKRLEEWNDRLTLEVNDFRHFEKENGELQKTKRDLQNQIKAYEVSYELLTGEVNELEKQIEHYEKFHDIDSDTMEQLNDEINALNEEIDELKSLNHDYKVMIGTLYFLLGVRVGDIDESL